MNTAYTVRLSIKFIDDLDDIMDFFFETTQDVALVLNIEKQILEAIKTLEYMPMRCPKMLSNQEINVFTFQKLPMKCYFTIDEINKIVDVVHIRHNRENPKCV